MTGQTVATDSIEIEDARDRVFAAIAQGALVNATTLPSGWRTPDRDMVIRGETLVAATPEESRTIGAPRSRSPY